MEYKIQSISKYNFWGDSQIDCGMERSQYTETAIRYLDARLVKVFTGQRRVGKSYVLRQLAVKLIGRGIPAENILLLNCELTAFSFLRTDKDLEELIELYKSELQPKGCIYLMIDEVQEIAGWERVVNSLSQDCVDPYEVFVTGSNSKMLSSELSTLLSGRYVEIPVFPLSFSEYARFYQLPTDKQSYISYMHDGGFPELLHLQGDDVKRNYVSALRDTVLLKDIVVRYTIKDVRLLNDIFVYLVNNASSLLSVNNIVNYLKSAGRKTSYETVAAYIGYIEDAYMARRAVRYNIRGREVMSSVAKYYLIDLSYKNYLYPGYGYGIGHKLENLVYLELLRHGYQVYVGVDKNREVDFVAQKGDRIIYLQSAYLMADEQTAEREYASLEAIMDNYEKYVVTLDDFKLPSHRGINHIRVWELEAILA